MSQIKKRTFSLPQGLSDFIDSKVESGNYASGSEVVRAGLRALQERHQAGQPQHKQKLSRNHSTRKDKQHSPHPIEDIFDSIRTR